LQAALYLPSYPPDFNPIEEAFSKIKTFIRKAEARSHEALIEAMGAAISASRLEMLAVSSSTAGTLNRFNHYEERCKKPSSIAACRYLSAAAPRCSSLEE
jgi:phosphopantetheine adenylyltransferase